MDRFQFDETRYDPTRPVRRISFLDIADRKNREYLKRYIKYQLGVTGISVQNIWARTYITKAFLRFLDQEKLAVDQLIAAEIDLYMRKLQEEYYIKRAPLQHPYRSVPQNTVREILQNLKRLPEDMRLMYLHLWCLGLRINEVCSIKREGYYLKEGVAWLRIYQHKLKMEKVIPIPMMLYRSMMVYMERKEIGLDAYVFQNSKGGPFFSTHYWHEMVDWCNELGIKCGDHVFQTHDYRHMKSMGRNLQEEAGTVKYLRLVIHFLEPEDQRPEWEKDIWNLENLGFEVRQNPIQMVKTISFTGIGQETIREEVKRASYIRIKYLSVGSLQGEIRAVRHFSEFLKERYPEIKSLGSVERLHIEEYLTHINLERGQERNLKTEMANLKDMLRQVGKVLEKPKLGKLFIKRDMPKAPEVTFKTYSDEEIRRLNEYIVNMEEQTACALILHQMLGGRISDTLTLRTDCLYQENGHYIVRMYQVKTSYYEKPVPEDVAKLIQKSMEYTYERYGETEYIFVNESNPSLPFQYSMLKHRMYALIHENDICKDNGERMGFATHLFRHCYGMKLVEMHLDDAAIAHLLGHRGVSTVYRYRRASGKLMIKETEELRKTMDEILSEIIKEWDGYEQVFQNG